MVLTPADLKTIAWPVPQLPPGAHRDPQEIVGNTVFDPMAQDEPVLSARLATPQSGGGSGVPVGMRGIDSPGQIPAASWRRFKAASASTYK